MSDILDVGNVQCDIVSGSHEILIGSVMLGFDVAAIGQGQILAR